jgi:acetyl-CoA carboxylase / biotin carboxylase 1
LYHKYFFILFSLNLSSKPKVKGETGLEKELNAIRAQLYERETYLTPIYHQIAVGFADLHDTPGRMFKKKTISGIIEWQNSRKFFYWRLRRLLAHDLVIRNIQEKIDINFEKSSQLVFDWFKEDHQKEKVKHFKEFTFQI